jgi:hypothetical protein
MFMARDGKCQTNKQQANLGEMSSRNVNARHKVIVGSLKRFSILAKKVHVGFMEGHVI